MDNLTDFFSFSFDDPEFLKSEIMSISNDKFDFFDEASSQAFITLIDEIDEKKDEIAELQKQLSDYEKENDGKPTTEDIEILEEMMELSSDQYWATLHLNALSEMKIVYLFKSLEIKMKSLIRRAYPKVKTKDFYQWDNMVTYFKSIDIDIPTIEGYGEALDLKKVNNCIKHSDYVSDEIKKIQEFKDSFEFTYDDIESFYRRIQPKIETFIKALGEAIVKDIFVFDDVRINSLSDSFKLRMTQDDLKKLSNKLIDGKKPEN